MILGEKVEFANRIDIVLLVARERPDSGATPVTERLEVAICLLGPVLGDFEFGDHRFQKCFDRSNARSSLRPRSYA